MKEELEELTHHHDDNDDDSLEFANPVADSKDEEAFSLEKELEKAEVAAAAAEADEEREAAEELAQTFEEDVIETQKKKETSKTTE